MADNRGGNCEWIRELRMQWGLRMAMGARHGDVGYEWRWGLRVAVGATGGGGDYGWRWGLGVAMGGVL